MRPSVNYIFLFLILFVFSCKQESGQSVQKASLEQNAAAKAEYALVIHGGAGTILKKNMTEEKEKAYREKLSEALDIGQKILEDGGSSMDAVEQVIIHLENSPLFNAGKGAVFTNAGKNELDASFMNGADLNAGAVGGVTTIKNPILAARAVMEKSAHVLLTGAGAEQFAREQGLQTVKPEYFFTQNRFDALERAKTAEMETVDGKFGTVGCVALDKNGSLAAGTSTGGMTNKKYNRIGDSPIIGAGTYANNNTCAVSCTGHGEFFIRYAVAHDVSAMMEYKGIGVEEAASTIIQEKLKNAGGSGGLIAVDKLGNVAMPFNTEGMYRGYVKPGKKVVEIYK